MKGQEAKTGINGQGFFKGKLSPAKPHRRSVQRYSIQHIHKLSRIKMNEVQKSLALN